MPEGSPGTGFDIRRLFSPGTQAREGHEDPRTEPHAPVHAAPENPTPITLEDMSDQGGVGSVSKAEATLTHPSARDSTSARALALRLTADGRDAGDDEEGGVDDGTPRRSAEGSGLEISSSSAAARLASRIAIARARADMRWLQRADKEKPKWCSRSKYCTRGGCNCNSVLRLRLY